MDEQETGGRLQVIVVDDDPRAVSVVERELGGGVTPTVTRASDCRSARNLLDDTTDLLIIDRRQPRRETLKLLHDVFGLEKSPQVMLTSGLGGGNPASCLVERGEAAHPAVRDALRNDLTDTVENAIARSALRRAESSLGLETAGRQSAIVDLESRLTGEVRTHASSQQLDRLVREAIDLTGEIALVLDFDGDIILSNRYASVAFGSPEREMLDRSFLDFIIDDDVERTAAACVEVLEGRTVQGLVNRARTIDGPRYLQWNCVPITDESGTVEAMQLTGRDVTEQRLTEEFLRHVNLELDDYAHTVSHDLKGPLSAIMLAAETLKLLLSERLDDEGGDEIRDIAEVISANTDRADTIVDALLEMAEAAQKPGWVEEVDVAEVIDEVVTELSSSAAARNARMVVGPGDKGVINGNRTQVYLVFSNLVRNAIEHCDSPAPVIEVSRLEDEAGGLRFLVRDDGSGIPESCLDKIFRPLFKGPGGGSGIGLATVRKIVGGYHGSIRAYNNHGACFEFLLRDLRP